MSSDAKKLQSPTVSGCIEKKRTFVSVDTKGKKKKKKPQECALCKLHEQESKKEGHKRTCIFEDISHWPYCMKCCVHVYSRNIMAINQDMRRSLENNEPFNVEERLQKKLKEPSIVSVVGEMESLLTGFLLNDDEYQRFRLDEPELRRIADELTDKQEDEMISNVLCVVHCCYPQEDDDSITRKICSALNLWKQQFESMDDFDMKSESDDESSRLKFEIKPKNGYWHPLMAMRSDIKSDTAYRNETAKADIMSLQ